MKKAVSKIIFIFVDFCQLIYAISDTLVLLLSPNKIPAK